MAELNAPERRECLRCGRREQWNETVHGWAISSEVGEPFCIHEWDVNGTHNPIVE